MKQDSKKKLGEFVVGATARRKPEQQIIERCVEEAVSGSILLSHPHHKLKPLWRVSKVLYIYVNMYVVTAHSGTGEMRRNLGHKLYFELFIWVLVGT